MRRPPQALALNCLYIVKTKKGYFWTSCNFWIRQWSRAIWEPRETLGEAWGNRGHARIPDSRLAKPAAGCHPLGTMKKRLTFGGCL